MACLIVVPSMSIVGLDSAQRMVETHTMAAAGCKSVGDGIAGLLGGTCNLIGTNLRYPHLSGTSGLQGSGVLVSWYRTWRRVCLGHGEKTGHWGFIEAGGH